MLNVSRPHLTKLVGRGEIKLEEWGKHRRVSLSALMDYRAKRNVMQEAALQEISRLGQECSQA